MAVFRRERTKGRRVTYVIGGSGANEPLIPAEQVVQPNGLIRAKTQKPVWVAEAPRHTPVPPSTTFFQTRRTQRHGSIQGEDTSFHGL